ncbi:hypothetical protein ACJIZ3_013877 [Penstemon smallii]|uniref:DUF7081 domain-containing protein n=1 Tax=Penstemon smallii TaxID=265156 RepID=A0ABD3RIP2_9LAMI
METDKKGKVGPVKLRVSGKGLPYAPENWPNHGDIWAWKVGNKVNSLGYHIHRLLIVPKRLQRSPNRKILLASKNTVTHFLQTEFPEADIDAFFASFTWDIPAEKSIKREAADLGSESFRRTRKSAKSCTRHTNEDTNISTEVKNPAEEDPTEITSEDFDTFINSLDDILSKSISKAPTSKSSSRMGEFTKARVELSSLLATDIPSLMNSEKLQEVYNLSNKLKNDPHLSPDELSKLNLIQEIALASEDFQRAKQAKVEACGFFSELEAKIACVTEMKSKCVSPKEKIAILEAENASLSSTIQEIDEHIAMLQKNRGILSKAVEINQSKITELGSTQKEVFGSLRKIVYEVQMANSEKAEWELKQKEAEKLEADILANFAPLEGKKIPCGLKENGFKLYPVSAGDWGEGLPYAPEDWPNLGGKWGWKAGRRTTNTGYFTGRCIYLPDRLCQDGKARSFKSRLSLEQYIRAKFPDADVYAFFASFSWEIPSKLCEEAADLGRESFRRTRKSARTCTRHTTEDTNTSTKVKIPEEEDQIEVTPEDIDTYINSLDDILSKSISKAPTSKSSSRMGKFTKARVELSSHLATDIPSLMKSEKLQQVYDLSNKLKNDPHLSPDELSKLNLIQEIALASKDFQRAKQAQFEACGFFSELEAKIARVTEMKSKCMSPKEKITILEAENASLSSTIQEIDERIAMLRKNRGILSQAVERNQSKITEMGSTQKEVFGSLQKIVYEIQMANSEKAEWELKQKEADKLEADILAKFAPLEGWLEITVELLLAIVQG